MLGPGNVGQRVVVRRIVGLRDNRPIFSDVLGELAEWGETEITVRTRAGAVRVPRKSITAAKTVPSKRRLSGTEAVELAAAYGWPAAESDRLGDWWLRATGGWTMRGNSALPIGDPDRPRDAAIDAVAAWYRARDLPPAISVPLPLLAGLDAELDRRGWSARPITQVMTAPLDAIVTGGTGEVRLDTAPAPEWLAMVNGRKGGAVIEVLTGVPEARFPLVPGPAGPLAVARGVVADPQRRWLGVSLIETAPEARRQGFAQLVVGALVDWAGSLGATDAYLQVEQRNTTAIALYQRIGFTVHHTYCSRVLTS